MRVGLVALICSLSGCASILGLEEVDDYVPRPPGTECTVATGAPVSKTITASEDTFISDDSNHLTSNFGGLDRMFACNLCDCAEDCESISSTLDDTVVSLLRFDLSAIPVCSDVTSASVTLTTTTDNIGSGSMVGVYEVLEAWTEGDGSVATGTTGAASWQQRQAGVAWGAAGASAPESRRLALMGLFFPNADETPYPFTIEVAVVQRWIDDPSSNNGMELAITGDTSDVHFYSSEGVAGKRPTLDITYTPP